MKHIKKFENVNDEQPLEVGEYVICRDSSIENDNLTNFLKNNIGRIVMYDTDFGEYPYKVTYDNIPTEIQNKYFVFFESLNCYVRSFKREEFIVHSKINGDLKHLIAANKYNL